MIEISLFDFIDLLNSRYNIHCEVLVNESLLPKRNIKSAEINRPGLCLAGFVTHFANERLQIFGKGEGAFVQWVDENQNYQRLDTFFTYEMPACIFTHNQEVPSFFLERCEKNGIIVLKVKERTNEFISLLLAFLDDIFAPRTTIHGVLVEIFGVGTLIQGSSGIGKSECALELIERGHRLIADDVIHVKRVKHQFIEGIGPKIIQHHMEIRGIGIINISKLYGAGSVREKCNIDLIIYLEEWQDNKEYERLGLEDRCKDILEVPVPYLLIPVRPGRNIPIIIETAAMNQRLKKMGINTAKDFNKKILDMMENHKGGHFPPNFWV